MFKAMGMGQMRSSVMQVLPGFQGSIRTYGSMQGVVCIFIKSAKIGKEIRRLQFLGSPVAATAACPAAARACGQVDTRRRALAMI